MNAMMRHLVRAACGLWVGLAGVAGAQTHPVLVELYTSQGCSSCPPADEFVAGLATDPGVLALSLHVDYWDYIGWKDTFGNAQFTKRQKAYAKASGSRMIYTPQIIVDGVDRIEGNDPIKVTESIRRHAATLSPVRLEVTREGGNLVIRAHANPPLNRGARVQLVQFIPKATVRIERGENAGREVSYYNVVTNWQAVGQWAGTDPLELTTELAGSDPAVVIVQSEGPGEVLAVARVD